MCFFFKQKTAYEMRISDWSSDVCSSDLTECTSSDPAAPAAEAGILPGDVLLSIDGTEVSTFADASGVIQEHPEDPVRVVLMRDGEEQSLTLTPVRTSREIVDENGETQLREVGFIGIEIGRASGRERVCQYV